MLNRTGLAIACALLAAAIYGMIPNLARFAFERGVPAAEVALFRTALIAVALSIAAVIVEERFRLPRAAWPLFLLQCLCTLAISVGYLASVTFIPVGLAVIVFFTFPVLILLVAPLTEGTRPGPVRIAIAAMAFAGLAIAVGPSFERLDPRGLALVALAAVAAVGQFLAGRGLSRHMGTLTMASVVHLAILPATLAVAAWAGGGKIAMFPGGGVGLAGYLALLGAGVIYCLAFFAQMTSLRNAPASTVAPFFNLEPVVTAVVAAVLLGEVLSRTQYLGGGIVLVALAASSIYDWTERKTHA